ncbi:DUF2274 domain-containing protein [Brevundimonas diminuta]|uniref:DUF2274 domain-containing protein n=1 Tax=Brevundimonas diminuta TaxID=293 RepID=UPI0030F72CC5
MTKLKLGALVEDKPVKLSVELPAAVYRDLEAYGHALARANEGAEPIAPTRLIAPMLERFMATDRGFAKARRQVPKSP